MSLPVWLRRWLIVACDVCRVLSVTYTLLMNAYDLGPFDVASMKVRMYSNTLAMTS